MSESIEQMREKAREITSRMSNDTEFRAQVLDDPGTTLVAAGLPAEAVPDFLAEERVGDVRGYTGCSVTCIITKCTLTLLEA